ncbi:hypothetical protein B0181_06740 [Moraxella caviae]|uniref:Type IV pilus biogenesis and competence protein pilQ n=1 Tax=Moraxella caviae TaxID=34060 RepID=A0A1T0A126_9GAMM|nr:type IV pilus secretin PilQ [Moraxella caviae]OOR89377.1 hypothetical protein B0181_06740 [Moraxella caviae]STZ09901.1 Type IV pilus biogenesis and competence protein pilQ precursor [Moraxella caviae]VEW12789.1 Type IV pilus biogenesis and competence protein pilQ precursor [Moraxella caviae]
MHMDGIVIRTQTHAQIHTQTTHSYAINFAWLGVLLLLSPITAFGEIIDRTESAVITPLTQTVDESGLIDKTAIQTAAQTAAQSAGQTTGQSVGQASAPADFAQDGFSQNGFSQNSFSQNSLPQGFSSQDGLSQVNLSQNSLPQVSSSQGGFSPISPVATNSAPSSATPNSTAPTYTGERVSLDFYDLPVRTVPDVLAHAGKANIVVSDAVTSNITLRLTNVPWDQALDIVIASKNLIKTWYGDVIMIESAEEADKRATNAAEQAQRLANLMPLSTEYVRLSYADASQMRDLLVGLQGNQRNTASATNLANTPNATNTDARPQGLLSARGAVAVDVRTNTLIIQDVPAHLHAIREAVRLIDVPMRQVMIEARIVAASDTFSRELGVNFGMLSDRQDLQIGGGQSTLWDMRTSNYRREGVTRPDNLSVNLGVANPAGSIAFGILSLPNAMLDLELSAMQATNQGEIISTPKVMTADKQTARISSGMQIAYQEETASGATNTVFKEAALVLEATPNITPDGSILLKLLVKNGTPVTNLGEIAIQEDAIETQVHVQDGQTVVLGGIYRHTQGNTVAKVPFFGDLPYIGRLFRNERRVNNKEELLIFVTPRLVNQTF